MCEQQDSTFIVRTSVADSLLSLLSLPTPESLSCFLCCSKSSTLDKKKRRDREGVEI